MCVVGDAASFVALATVELISTISSSKTKPEVGHNLPRVLVPWAKAMAAVRCLFCVFGLVSIEPKKEGYVLDEGLSSRNMIKMRILSAEMESYQPCGVLPGVFSVLNMWLHNATWWFHLTRSFIYLYRTNPLVLVIFT